MEEFRSKDPVFAPDANVQYELDANEYLDKYNITVDQYDKLNQRWRENAEFYRDIFVRNAIFEFENKTKRHATETDIQAIINEAASLGYNKSQLEDYKDLFSPTIRFLNRTLKPNEDFPNPDRGYFLSRDAKKSEGIADAFLKVTTERKEQLSPEEREHFQRIQEKREKEYEEQRERDRIEFRKQRLEQQQRLEEQQQQQQRLEERLEEQPRLGTGLGGSRRRNKKTKNLKKRSNKSRKNHCRK
jgi:hypothetical protein